MTKVTQQQMKRKYYKNKHQ